MPDTTMLDTLARHLAAEAEHDAVAAAACYTEDGWYEYLSLGLRFDGREQVAAQYAASYESMPDLATIFEQVLVDGNHVVQMGRLTGTVMGPFLGIEPTGRFVDVGVSAEYGFRDGLIEYERVLFDIEALAAQAGLDISSIRSSA